MDLSGLDFLRVRDSTPKLALSWVFQLIALASLPPRISCCWFLGSEIQHQSWLSPGCFS
uniref:Uncharacterized protein n=1 Tax=Setaria italica TaxID=4555 RepID=K3ZG44_SETIT